jgi:glycosyltransferase involved in cell wall biosynthesis
MKIAIIHEWLVNYAGSERVLEQIIKLYPDADLFCQVDFLPDDEREFILNKKTNTSFIQNLPNAKDRYRSYLPLMPFAVKKFDMSGYDVIISNSHSVAKGVNKNPQQLQICYCHTPMRYAWDLQSQYLKESGLDSGIKGMLAKYILNRLKKWDYAASQKVNYFIANSSYIKDRIKRAYNKDSSVIYPPVDIDNFQLKEEKDNYFLAVSRMVPYKRMDLIVDAFSEFNS